MQSLAMNSEENLVEIYRDICLLKISKSIKFKNSHKSKGNLKSILRHFTILLISNMIFNFHS